MQSTEVLILDFFLALENVEVEYFIKIWTRSLASLKAHLWQIKKEFLDLSGAPIYVVSLVGPKHLQHLCQYGTIHLGRQHVLGRGGRVSPCAYGPKVTVHKDQKSPS